jgi:hypothetical protein
MAKRAIKGVSPATKTINRRPLLGTGVTVAAAFPDVPALASVAQSIRPTELGRELLRRLPHYVAALWKIRDLRRALKAKKVAHVEAFARIGEIAQAIVARPATDMAHLVDLAIVARWEYDSSYPTSNGAERLLVAFLLKLGGVVEADCDVEAIEKIARRSTASSVGRGFARRSR